MYPAGGVIPPSPAVEANRVAWGPDGHREKVLMQVSAYVQVKKRTLVSDTESLKLLFPPSRRFTPRPVRHDGWGVGIYVAPHSQDRPGIVTGWWQQSTIDKFRLLTLEGLSSVVKFKKEQLAAAAVGAEVRRRRSRALRHSSASSTTSMYDTQHAHR